MSESTEARWTQLCGYSELSRLDHSKERLQELYAQVSDVLASLERLDAVDVELVEAAVLYERPTRDASS